MSKKTNKRYAFVIETAKCIDCKACMVACKAENGVPVGHSRNWVNEDGPKGVFPNLSATFEPGNCMHCEKPACERVCPTRAITRTEEGIVLTDQDRCIGCRYCMMACPYNARYLDQARGVVDKCNFCVQRLTAGLDTACVNTCMTGARNVGDIHDPKSQVSRLMAKHKTHVKILDAGTRPSVFYIDG